MCCKSCSNGPAQNHRQPPPPGNSSWKEAKKAKKANDPNCKDKFSQCGGFAKFYGCKTTLLNGKPLRGQCCKTCRAKDDKDAAAAEAAKPCKDEFSNCNDLARPGKPGCDFMINKFTSMAKVCSCSCRKWTFRLWNQWRKIFYLNRLVSLRVLEFKS